MPRQAITEPAPRPVGRPRDERVDAAIRAATLELLVDGGYNQLSIEAIARRAGTTKRTIYRRWPSKAHLVHEIVFPATDDYVMPPDTGDLAADIRRMVTGTLRTFERPEARSATPGLMAEFRDDPELHRLLTARLEREARAAFRTMIDAGVARGDVRAGVDADVVFDVVAGTVLFAILVSEAAQRADIVDHVADLVAHAVRA